MSFQCRMKVEDSKTCNAFVWKCKRCSGMGCANSQCRNQAFDGSLCLKCGQTAATC